MARMFCTLKEAAAWLDTSESDLRTMLAQGMLPEFRKGNSRLLRISDVRDVVKARSCQNRERVESEATDAYSNLSHTCTPQEAGALEIKLPRTGTALLDPPLEDVSPLRPTDHNTWSTPDEIPDWDEYEETHCHHGDKPAYETEAFQESSPWLRSLAEQAPARRGLWMGIVEDRPMAILGFSALVIAIASAVASGVYVLVRFLQ